MATSAIRTRIDTELTNRGLSLTGALANAELTETINLVKAAGGKISKAADVTGTYDTFVLATIASQTHTITVKAAVVGPGAGIVTVAIAVAGDDTLAVTNVAGVITISLANTTGAKNTLTLIKAAIDAANSSTLGVTHSVVTFITGTASTQMANGGTNTVAATAAGGTAAGGIASSTAGAAQAGVISVLPV